MGYDNVLKDVKKREVAERAAILKRRIEESGIIQDEIYHILPLNEEEAISIANLKSHFPKKSIDYLRGTMCSIFNKGRCKRIKRYDSKVHPSLTHCYYWKEMGMGKKSVPSIQGMYNSHEEESSLRKEIFNEMPRNYNSAVTLNDMCERRGLEHNNSGIASALYFHYTLNNIKRVKRGRLFYYWRDADNKDYEDIRGINEKRIKQTTKAFLLGILSSDTSHGITVRTLLIAGGGKYTKDAIESALQKLIKNQQIVRSWDGKRYYYQHAGPNENLKLEQKKTISLSPSSTEEVFNKGNAGRAIIPDMEKVKSLREKIFDELPSNKDDAMSVGDIRRRMRNKHVTSSIAASLCFLYNSNRVKREKQRGRFCYWRIVSDETEVVKTTRNYVDVADFIRNNLYKDQSNARTAAELSRLSNGIYTVNVILDALNRLHNRREIQSFKKGGVIYYRIPSQTLASSSPSPSTEELLTKYKADNKKLDERIANIENQIADLGRKQELEAEIQKREENEKRLAELEEQLHKISLADTSVKRGILH